MVARAQPTDGLVAVVIDAKRGGESAKLRNKGKIMQVSNGYGSAVQEIAVHVDRKHAAEVEALLGTPPYKVNGNPPRTYFLIHRQTVRPGNDEDVVFDLWRELGDPREKFDWEIDWQSSNY